MSCPNRLIGGAPGGARPRSGDRPPLLAVGEAEPGERLRPHLGAVAGRRRHDVAGVADDDRVEEVLVEVVDVLDHPTLERAADADVVEDREVLDELAQADAAGVRADRDAELGRHAAAPRAPR